MNNFKKEMREWLTAIVIGILLVIFIKMFIVTNYEVVGQSMMPTLHDQDKVVVNKLSKINHMDIVIFHGDEREDYVKRVIGLPGDMIRYENDELFINNEKVEEPYLQSFSAYDNPEENFTENFNLDELTGRKRVPPGKLFVLGDNRISSMDSRYFHFVDTTEVVGEVQARYWPLSQATTQFYPE